MKKSLLLIIASFVFLVGGCSNRGKMVDFIPTSTPAPEINVDSPDATGEPQDSSAGTEDNAEADTKDEGSNTTTDQPVVGKTTTKYVKMEAYDDTLNVRATPSTTGEKVGFLVHTEKVDVIEIKDGWASILYEGKICYVKADFLVDERPAYLDPPTPKPADTPTPTPDPNAGAPEI